MTLALPLPARRLTVNLNPTVLSTLITISGLMIVGVAALGQWRWNAVKVWREMAEANAAMVVTLKSQLAAAEQQLMEARRDNELMRVRMDSLERSVAYVERQNHLLQNEMDRRGIELDRQGPATGGGG